MIFHSINPQEYNYIFVSTTAKHDTDIMKLPDKMVNDEIGLNFLISSKLIAESFFKHFDRKHITIFADLEEKQNVNLYDLARSICKNATIAFYKPNDLTLEAADQYISKFLQGNFSNKKILIYGTGNLAFKLALRLSEKNINIYLDGRNKKKVASLVETLNIVSFSKNVMPFNGEKDLDGLISFVSADRVIEKEYYDYFTKDAFFIDGGIGNFSEDFIEKVVGNHQMICRLDVRISDSFLTTTLNNFKTNFFDDIMGCKQFEGINYVAGGIIGDKSSIIVDKINHPSKIFGIANGIGGIKNVREYSEKDKEQVSRFKKEFLSDNEKNV